MPQDGPRNKILSMMKRYKMNNLQKISTIALTAAICLSPNISSAQDTAKKKFSRDLHNEDSEKQLPQFFSMDGAGETFTEWHHLTKDWFGLRPYLAEHGVNFSGKYKGDNKFYQNDGNKDSSRRHKSHLSLNGTFDFGKIAGIDGLVVFTSFSTWDDQGGSEGSQLDKIWIEQEVLDGQFKVKIGKLGVGDDFHYNKNSSGFLGGRFSESPTVLGSPFDTTAFGMVAQTLPTENTYISLGVFDGAAHRGYPLSKRGPKTLFGNPGDTFLIGEAGYSWKNRDDKNRSIGGGVWHHSGPHAHNDGVGEQSGVFGFYGLYDFDINSESEGSKQGLKGFARYAYTDPAYSTVDHELGFGLNYLGLIPSRDDDRCGVGISFANISESVTTTANEQMLYEAFYNYKWTKFITVHLNYQLNTNPDLTDATIENQEVFNLRFVVKF